jgi:alpha-1,3-rhamnosyl/mannosyltransferase
MASGTAVITSNCSSLKEAGGDAAILINPKESNEIFNAMKQLKDDDSFRTNSIKKGIEHANHFTNEKCAQQVMNVYKKMIL